MVLVVKTEWAQSKLWIIRGMSILIYGGRWESLNSPLTPAWRCKGEGKPAQLVFMYFCFQFHRGKARNYKKNNTEVHVDVMGSIQNPVNYLESVHHTSESGIVFATVQENDMDHTLRKSLRCWEQWGRDGIFFLHLAWWISKENYYGESFSWWKKTVLLSQVQSELVFYPGIRE